MPTVLYIDSDQSYRRLLKACLAAHNFEVDMAKDGLEGVKKARELRPDLILMDLYLPRMDSLEVIEQLKCSSLTWDIPIVLVSKLPAHRCYQFVKVAGAQGYVAKPFKTEELIKTIRKNLPLKRKSHL